MPREQELSMLRDQAEWLKSQLDQISARVSELEAEGDE
jgi:prefoldin subunit 5